MKFYFTHISNKIKGFSLIEILVGMSLLGILTGVTGGVTASILMSLNLTNVVMDRQQLYESLAKTIGDNGDSCKGNLAPKAGSIPTTGSKEGLYNDGTKVSTTGVGKLAEIYTFDGLNVKGTPLIKLGDFGHGLDIKKIALSHTDATFTTAKHATNDVKDRELKVYFKHKRGSFQTKSSGTCTSADISGCYSISCRLTSYRITTADAVDQCQATCTNVKTGGGSGGEIKCADGTSAVKVTPDGRTLFGCGTTQANLHNTTAFGFNAGNSGAGTENTFIGYESGKATTDRANTFIGYRSGVANTTGDNNTFLGLNAGVRNTTGHGNTFLGSTTGSHNTTGHANTFLGIYAGASNTTGVKNVFIGQMAGNANLDTNHNTYIGRSAGICFAKGNNNVFIGQQAGFGRIKGSGDWACPTDKADNTGFDNIVIGVDTAFGLKDGSKNVFIGHRAGFKGDADTANVITGGENVVIGYQSGTKLTSGSKNTFLGFESGKANNTGYENTFIGYRAGEANTSGYDNLFLGQESGKSNTTGMANVFIGERAGNSHTKGAGNIFIGSESGRFTNSATANQPTNNIFIGGNAGRTNTTGDSNIFIGSDSGRHKDSSNSHTSVQSGHEITGDRNIFIGRGIGQPPTGGISGGVDYQLNIGNLIFGKMPTAPPTATTNFFAGNTDTTKQNYLQESPALVINGSLYVKGKAFANCGDNNGDCGPWSTSLGDSSRVFKNTITLFKNYQYALSVINNTPLFTYFYNKDHPKHKRMGIIAEDLPKHLQIQDKNEPPKPDWVSIYGTLWAGIKALYNRFMGFKKEVTQKLTSIVNDLKKLIHNSKELKRRIDALEKKIEVQDKIIKILRKEKEAK